MKWAWDVLPLTDKTAPCGLFIGSASEQQQLVAIDDADLLKLRRSMRMDQTTLQNISMKGKADERLIHLQSLLGRLILHAKQCSQPVKWKP